MDDLEPVAGLCYAAILRSPHSCAEILSIDVEAARKLPGVIEVSTPDDVVAMSKPIGNLISRKLQYYPCAVKRAAISANRSRCHRRGTISRKTRLISWLVSTQPKAAEVFFLFRRHLQRCCMRNSVATLVYATQHPVRGSGGAVRQGGEGRRMQGQLSARELGCLSKLRCLGGLRRQQRPLQRSGRISRARSRCTRSPAMRSA